MQIAQQVGNLQVVTIAAPASVQQYNMIDGCRERAAGKPLKQL
jgi:hypothetical protein